MKLFVLPIAVNCLDAANQSTADVSPYQISSRVVSMFEDECPDAEIGANCVDKCQEVYLKCYTACDSDLDCKSGCSREMNVCIKDCPCLDNCPLGCKGCKHPDCKCVIPEDSVEYFDCASAATEKEKRCEVDCGIHDTECHAGCETEYNESHENCPCKKNCSSGCPCDDYICREMKTSVLVLTTVNDNPPLRVDANGEPSYDISMTYDYRTQVHGSCTTFFRGEMYVLGGELHKTQVSVIDGCNLKRLVDLPFEFSYGTCEQIDDFVAMCFPNEGTNKCKKFKGVYGPSLALEMMAQSTYTHQYSHLAQLKGELVIVGGGRLQYEHYNVAKDTWSYINTAPIGYNNYAVVSLEKSIIYFGGTSNGSSVIRDIYRYTGVHSSWSRLGYLATARQRHNAIQFGNGFLVIGGAGQLYTEYCSFNDELNNSVTCASQEPELKNYAYDEVFAVVPKFCAN